MSISFNKKQSLEQSVTCKDKKFKYKYKYKYWSHQAKANAKHNSKH